MDIYEIISDGVPFKISLQERSLTVGHKKMIDHGEIIVPIDGMDEQITKEMLEDLFLEYTYSGYDKNLPKNHYFQKVKERNLSQSDMICCSNPHLSRFMLEFAVLRGILNGSIQWCIDEMDEHHHFFWKSNKIPQFIIYKNFIAQ